MMLQIARYNTLNVLKKTRSGYLLGDQTDQVLLPGPELRGQVNVGERLRVFVYNDSEGRPVASMREPRAILGEFAYLPCVQVSEHGAHLDWGMAKDLFVPFAEQHARMQEGRSYVVVVCLDEREHRPMASSKLAPHFDYDLSELQVGDEASLLVFGHNEAGAQVVVDQRYVGLVYTDATFRDMPLGSEHTGFVAQLRSDNRVDVSLTRPTHGGRSADQGDAQERILQALRAADGFLPLHDKSPPEAIQQALGLSKKVFKRSAGALYKARRIRIGDDGIQLLDDEPEPDSP